MSDPGRVLTRLCAALDVREDPAMLGPFKGDWQAHEDGDACWYADGGQLTPVAQARLAEVQQEHADLVRRCQVMQRELLESELRGVCSTLS